MTYSFPCQDLSVAGKMKGMTKGSGTRSGLLWEVERLLTECKELPQVLVMENVVQVHSPGENMKNFQLWIDFLTSLGYSSYWKNMQATDYGMAQHRERCIMVSILGEYQYKFPEPRPLEKFVDAYLEDEVDEKYYLKSDKTKILLDMLAENGTIPQTDRQTDRQTDSSLWTSLLTIQDETKSQTVLQQETILESETERQKVVVCARGFRGKAIKFGAKETEVAHTVLAHASQGTSNLGEDFIICKKK